MIKVVLESTHQIVSNDILYIIWRLVFIKIQVYQCSDIISYFLKLSWQSTMINDSPTRYKFWLYDRNNLHTDYYYYINTFISED